MTGIENTEGIVLKTIVYGESSLVAHIFTQHYGLQHYLIQGVRKPKKGSQSSNVYQIGNLLRLEVRHNPLKNLQRISSSSLLLPYNQITGNIIKYYTLLFVVELLGKILKQPEPHTRLFDFIKNFIFYIEQAPAISVHSIIWFLVHLADILGFSLKEISSIADTDNFKAHEPTYYDYTTATFSANIPTHSYYFTPQALHVFSDLPNELKHEPSLHSLNNSGLRRNIIEQLLHFYEYQLHASMLPMQTWGLIQQLF